MIYLYYNTLISMKIYGRLTWEKYYEEFNGKGWESLGWVNMIEMNNK